MIHRREKLQVNVVQVQTLRSFYEDFKRKGFGVKRYEFSFCPISSFFNHPPTTTYTPSLSWLCSDCDLKQFTSIL